MKAYFIDLDNIYAHLLPKDEEAFEHYEEISKINPRLINEIKYREQWFELERAAEMKKTFAKVKCPKPISHALPLQELQSVFMSENNKQLVVGLLLMQHLLQ